MDVSRKKINESREELGKRDRKIDSLVHTNNSNQIKG